MLEKKVQRWTVIIPEKCITAWNWPSDYSFILCKFNFRTVCSRVRWFCRASYGKTVRDVWEGKEGIVSFNLKWEKRIKVGDLDVIKGGCGKVCVQNHFPMKWNKSKLNLDGHKIAIRTSYSAMKLDFTFQESVIDKRRAMAVTMTVTKYYSIFCCYCKFTTTRPTQLRLLFHAKCIQEYLGQMLDPSIFTSLHIFLPPNYCKQMAMIFSPSLPQKNRRSNHISTGTISSHHFHLNGCQKPIRVWGGLIYTRRPKADLAHPKILIYFYEDSVE